MGSAASAEFPRYSIERIEAPPAYLAEDLNRNGDVVGRKYVNNDFIRVADIGYRQFAGGAPELFPDVPGGRRSAVVRAINDDGLAVATVIGELIEEFGFTLDGYRSELIRRDGTRIDLSAVWSA